ncbi:MAG: glycine cleavage system protein H [Candidatus Kryptoniota bacterium]
MFPWVFGFTWQAGHLIFLGIFYSVAAVIFTTFIAAAKRSVRTIKSGGVDEISWHDDFAELPASTKVCRHTISGELQSRICPNGFDCRICQLHPELVLAKAASKHLTKAQKSSRGHDDAIFGLNMPTDRLYHRGHTWVKKGNDGTLTVGLDDFGRKIIGNPDAVDLPEIGTELEVNGTGWLFEKDGTMIRVLSPVEGKVIEIGNGESESSRDGKDFYLRVEPKNGIDLRHLLKGEEIRPWITREMERLESMLSSENVGLSLADGGELVSDLPKSYPEVDWDNVLGEVFLEP